MAPEPTPEQHRQLAAFHKDWWLAQQRRAMAQQTLSGAQADETVKQARFYGAAEFVFGTTEVGFDYDADSDTLTFRQPNRETRRALAKKRKSGANRPRVK